jgi:hypothetical protein
MTPEIAKRFRKIRNLAINCLKEQDTSMLEIISLQLVQALRYEEVMSMYNMIDSPLRDLLLDKAKENQELAHSLQWHLELERNNVDNHTATKQFFNEIWNDLMNDLEENAYE